HTSGMALSLWRPCSLEAEGIDVGHECAPIGVDRPLSIAARSDELAGNPERTIRCDGGGGVVPPPRHAISPKCCIAREAIFRPDACASDMHRTGDMPIAIQLRIAGAGEGIRPLHREGDSHLS